MPGPPRSSSPPPLPAPVDKPESDKLAKTVLPNAVRTITPESSAPLQPSGSRARMVAVGATATRPGDLPPAVALALEPKVERVLSVALSDVVDRMPQGYLKPRESFDTTRRVLLKAADVEKGMATGRPIMTVAALYQQLPEIFMHSVPAADTSVVELPFKKLLDELSTLRIRHDQTQEQIAAQYQTPFLQVAVEEAKKFGTKMEPVQVAEFPRVHGMAPASAEAIAAAEPEATAQEKFTPSHLGGGIRSRQVPVERPIAPAEKRREPPPEISTAREQKPPTGKIPFSLEPTSPPEKSVVAPSSRHLPEEPLPNGTGEPAFPRVPASSGPPVPPSVPAQPTRIPFKLTPDAPSQPVAAPSLQTKEKSEPAISTPLSEPQVSTGQPIVTLRLRPILESIPPMQIGGDISTVPPDTKISFPLTLIAPQLATGKVVIQPKEFHAALPPAHRNLFLPDAVDAPVPLSLPDVLANLPGDALQMRTDQEVVTQDEIFETPFSTKAAEDAKRFASDAGQAQAQAGTVSSTGLQKPEGGPASEAGQTKFEIGSAKAATPPKVVEVRPTPAAPLPSISMASQHAEEIKPRIEPVTLSREQPAKIEILPKAPISVPAEPKFEAKEAVIQASALPGVASCSINFADGLNIAGNIPPEMHVDGLSAMAPTLLTKLEKHMLETQLGALTCLTVHGQNRPITFFASGNICLTAVHSGAELSAESRRELASITEKLSRTYAQPGAAHVDH